VVVLKEGKTGFLGFGGEEATVRVFRRQPEELRQEAVTLAKEVLEEILPLMQVSASVEVKEPSEEGRAIISLEINGEDLGILIGRRGQTFLLGEEVRPYIHCSIWSILW